MKIQCSCTTQFPESHDLLDFFFQISIFWIKLHENPYHKLLPISLQTIPINIILCENMCPLPWIKMIAFTNFNI